MPKAHKIKSHLLCASRFKQLYGYLEIFKHQSLGRAVRSKRRFKKGELICEFRGKLFTMKQMKKLSNPDNDQYLQVTEDLYLGPTKTADCFINHSCNPNGGFVISDGHVLFMAIRDIPAGPDITFDYSTMMAEDFWEMDCICGSKLCRKRIRDFKHLPVKLQNRYLHLGIVPDFVIASLAKHKREKRTHAS